MDEKLRLATLASVMPMQPTGALNQEVDRCQVGNHEIKIEIERLLDNLCCNQHTAPAFVRLTTLSKSFKNSPFD